MKSINVVTSGREILGWPLLLTLNDVMIEDWDLHSYG